MTEQQTHLEERLSAGKKILIMEMLPPKGADPEAVSSTAKRCATKVSAVGVSDNRESVRMSALAAAALIAAEGVEPILHVVTRDRNRIALVSEAIGAQALGVRNLLCTSGTHQMLGSFRSARNVYDIDSVQLLQLYAGLSQNGSLVGENQIEGAGTFCLGAVASPYADPLEFQLIKLSKKVTAGAKFLITQPIFDFDRFQTWWKEIRRVGLDEKTAIIAGIQPLTNRKSAEMDSQKKPSPVIPASMIERLSSKSSPEEQRAEGIAMAVETIEKLSNVEGLRGFEICGRGDEAAAWEVIDKSGLRMD